MPTKRYRLKKDHPYAEKGTIVEEEYNNGCVLFLKPANSKLTYVHDISIPIPSIDAWLEEVKEVICSKEFAEALKIAARGNLHIGAVGYLVSEEWLSAHTSTEE